MGAAFGSRLSAIGQKWQEGGVEAAIGNRLSAGGVKTVKTVKMVKSRVHGKKTGRIWSDLVGLGRIGSDEATWGDGSGLGVERPGNGRDPRHRRASFDELGMTNSGFIIQGKRFLIPR
jgi:hypothetical protein